MWGIDVLLDTLVGRDGELTVVTDKRDLVVLDARNWWFFSRRIEFLGSAKLVRIDGKPTCRFSEIKSIDLTSISDQNWSAWAISLNTGTFSSVEVGWRENETDASITAASLSTVTGASVRAL